MYEEDDSYGELIRRPRKKINKDKHAQQYRRDREDDGGKRSGDYTRGREKKPVHRILEEWEEDDDSEEKEGSGQ
ncbi:MAG TPA: hypothetical protein VMX35_09650 [Acidobacteriota bacterium]|nr:hypothetical protein [Acidobacteriota bacterium]